MDSIRVLLVDDHELFLDGLSALMDTTPDIEVVGRANNGARALELVDELGPDVLLLDYTMKPMDGPGVVRRLKESGVFVKVLFVSMNDNVQYALRAIECGANGYVTKGSSGQDLLAAVRIVFDGGQYVSPPLDAEVARHGPVPMNRSGLDKLSPREFELLRHLAQGKSLQEASSDMKIKSSTASTYRARLMSKLALPTTPQIIKYALENGIEG